MQNVFTKEDFLEAIKTSKNHSETAKKLGYKKCTNKYYKFIKELNPDTSHFDLKSRSHKKGDSLEQMYNTYKRKAKKRNYTFKLTLEEFTKLAMQKCGYCNGHGDSKIGKSDKYFCGIDRKNNNIGYIYNNCISCCKTCNFMKGRLSYMDFLSQVKKIYKFQCF